MVFAIFVLLRKDKMVYFLVKKKLTTREVVSCGIYRVSYEETEITA